MKVCVRTIEISRQKDPRSYNVSIPSLKKKLRIKSQRTVDKEVDKLVFKKGLNQPRLMDED